MSGPRVELWDHVGLGLIISWPTGITYTNQTGGTSCLAPELEGVFVPLGNDCTENNELISPANTLWDYFVGPKWQGTGAVHGLDEQDADFIQSVLRGVKGEWRGLPSMQVDRDRLKESHEAWVHVIVEGDDATDPPVFGGFAPYPRAGVLTWQNSD